MKFRTDQDDGRCTLLLHIFRSSRVRRASRRRRFIYAATPLGRHARRCLSAPRRRHAAIVARFATSRAAYIIDYGGAARGSTFRARARRDIHRAPLLAGKRTMTATSATFRRVVAADMPTAEDVRHETNRQTGCAPSFHIAASCPITSRRRRTTF